MYHRPRHAPQPHLTTAPPHVRPAPKPAIASVSPLLTFPDRTASSSARGMDAAEVFPYSAKFDTIRSCGIFNLSPTASRILWLAWCITTQSTSSAVSYAFWSAALIVAGTLRTANLKTSCPFISILLKLLSRPCSTCSPYSGFCIPPV